MIVLYESLRKRANQVAIAFKAKDFEPGETPLAKAAPIVFDGLLLRHIAHA
jgi:hypothetical protein